MTVLLHPLSACNSTDESPIFQAKLALLLEDCQENRSVLSAVGSATPVYFPCRLAKVVLSCKKVLRVKMTAAEIFLSLYWEVLFLIVPIFPSLSCGFSKIKFWLQVLVFRPLLRDTHWC